MRVLVTGASGVFGRTICRSLVRQGADVVAFARRPLELSGVTAVRGDIRDQEALEQAMQGCSRVMHLAFVLAPLRSATGVEEINVGGTRNVLRAMERTGAEHLVFTSSTLAYGPWPDNPELINEDQPLRPHPDVLYARHKAQCEEIIGQSGIPSVITRTCVVAGRDMDNYEFRFLAHPALAAPTGPMRPWQFLHTDDVGRFHAQALLGDKTGVVNVGPRDSGLTIEEIAEVLGKPLFRLPFGVLRRATHLGWRADVLELSPADLDGFRYMPTLDTRRLVEDWHYEPACGSREALAEVVTATSGVTYLGTSKVPMPWRTPTPDHRWEIVRRPAVEGRVDPAPPGLRGEFDDLIDPRYPTLTTANVGEAFVGTQTPMSLFVNRDAMRVAGAFQVEILGMRDPDLVAAQRDLAIASVGHRLYTNLSVVHAMASAMPGTSPADVDQHILGLRPEDVPAEDFEAPALRSRVRQALSLPAAGLRMRGAGSRSDDVGTRVGHLALDDDALRAVTDNALLTLVDACRESTMDAWALSTTTNLVASAAQNAVRRLAPNAGPQDTRGGTKGLASADLLGGVQELAAMAKLRPELARLLHDEPAVEVLSQLEVVDARFARAFAALVSQAGHRGPGETELANLMYGDDPSQLLAVIAKAVDSPSRTSLQAGNLSTPGRAAVRALSAAVRRRERAKDVVLRSTHAHRRALRELARRYVERDQLAEVSDVFYLTPEEVNAPALFSSRVTARREERKRLASLTLPSLFTGSWEPLSTSGSETSRWLGLGVSPGRVHGAVRVLADGSDGDALQPGEVLVTRVTDIGWTALFALASAVVTDVGGLHSHAAIVAREFGIPCVVATDRASLDLRTGQQVVVDGTTGVVELCAEGSGLR